MKKKTKTTTEKQLLEIKKLIKEIKLLREELSEFSKCRESIMKEHFKEIEDFFEKYYKLFRPLNPIPKYPEREWPNNPMLPPFPNPGPMCKDPGDYITTN